MSLFSRKWSRGSRQRTAQRYDGRQQIHSWGRILTTSNRVTLLPPPLPSRILWERAGTREFVPSFKTILKAVSTKHGRRNNLLRRFTIWFLRLPIFIRCSAEKQKYKERTVLYQFPAVGDAYMKFVDERKATSRIAEYCFQNVGRGPASFLLVRTRIANTRNGSSRP